VKYEISILLMLGRSEGVSICSIGRNTEPIEVTCFIFHFRLTRDVLNIRGIVAHETTFKFLCLFSFCNTGIDVGFEYYNPNKEMSLLLHYKFRPHV
jgi:hypothetical protein